MDNGEARAGPARSNGGADVIERLPGHGDVRLVFEPNHSATSALVSHHAGEGHYPAQPLVFYSGGDFIQRERSIDDVESRAPTGHGRNQRQLGAAGNRIRRTSKLLIDGNPEVWKQP